MGLVELVARPATGTRTNKVVAAYGRMSKADAEAFRTVIINPDDYSSADIARAITSAEHPIASSQIVHYRTLLREGKVSL